MLHHKDTCKQMAVWICADHYRISLSDQLANPFFATLSMKSPDGDFALKKTKPYYPINDKGPHQSENIHEVKII